MDIFDRESDIDMLFDSLSVTRSNPETNLEQNLNCDRAVICCETVELITIVGIWKARSVNLHYSDVFMIFCVWKHKILQVLRGTS